MPSGDREAVAHATRAASAAPPPTCTKKGGAATPIVVTIVVVILFVPPALQVHFLLMIFLDLIYTPVFCMASFATLLLLPVGLVCFVVCILCKRHIRLGALAFVVPAAMVGMLTLSMVLWEKQYEHNVAQGTVLAEAILRYRDDGGGYPGRLDDLIPEYLDSLPKYRVGLFRFRFIYWHSAGPRLKFPAGFWTGVFYDFNARQWRPSTL